MKTKSDLYQTNYCIFIGENTMKKIKKTELKNGKIELIVCNDDPNLFCVVVPLAENHTEIEKELFNIREQNEGFWGQWGIGYKGKEWNNILN